MEFSLGNLLNIIYIIKDCLRGICLWNNEYLFVGCDDNTKKLIDIYNNKIIKFLKGHKDYVITIKLIIQPKYGKCLISQGKENDQIKLWKN